MQCNNPFYLKEYNFYVPCNRCRACKIARVREWTIRLLHELKYHETGCFLTLTYSPENLPKDNSINKRELQLFFKRLRFYYPFRIKYFSCGEYGDTYHRPHYHALVYGIDRNHIKIIEKSWQLGYVHIGNISRQSIQYVVGYISKKYYGKWNIDKYLSKGLQPPFQLQSKGLGFEYALDNFYQLNQNLYINFNKTKVKIPRYYLKKFNFDKERLKNQAIERSEERDKNIVQYHSEGNLLTGEIYDYYTEVYHLTDAEYLKTLQINPHNENTLKSREELFKRGTL